MHKKKKNRYVKLVVVSTLAIGVAFGLWYLKDNCYILSPQPADAFPPALLKIGFKVNSLSGKIKSIGDKVLYIEIHPQKAPDQSLVYKIQVPEDARVETMTQVVPYLYKKPNIALKKLPLHELKEGQFVTVEFENDIRNEKPSALVAKSVVALTLNTISGQVDSIAGNTITISAHPPVPSFALNPIAIPSTTRKYYITVNALTEISHYIGSFNKALDKEKLTLAGLKPGTEVTVYTDSDLTFSQSGSALRIEPR